MANIYDSANGWVNTLIENALANSTTDKTILCIVIDNNAADVGKYKVQYNSIEFYAFTDNNKQYKINDSVYVLIPQGDYNEQKIILCKKW